MIAVVDLLIMDSALNRFGCPFAIDQVGKGVLLSDKHGDWDRLDSRNINFRRGSSSVNFEVSGGAVVEFLVLTRVDLLSIVRELSPRDGIRELGKRGFVSLLVVVRRAA